MLDRPFTCYADTECSEVKNDDDAKVCKTCCKLCFVFVYAPTTIQKTNVVSYCENNIWDDYWIDNISRRMRWAHEHESINKTEW